MTSRRTVLLAAAVSAYLVSGCATTTSYVRQKDGTYKKTTHLTMRPYVFDQTWTSDEDYMVATRICGVMYVWPKGKGTWDLDSAYFQGDQIECTAKKRSLMVDGQLYGEFEAGDKVRITGDGQVILNEPEEPDDTGD